MFKRTLLLTMTFLAVTEARFNSKKETPVYLADLEVLADTEVHVIRDLQAYVDREKHRLMLLGEWLRRLKIEYVKASKDVTFYLGNPINAFTLIKRLGMDLSYVENVIRDETEFKRHPQTVYPTEADLIDSVWALDLLRDKYGLTVSQLANGILQSNASQSKEMYTEIVAPMNPTHVYMIGHTFMTNQDYQRAMPWLQEAFSRMEQDGCKDCKFTILDVIQDILRGYLHSRDYENYIIWDEKRVALEPHDLEHPENRIALKRAMEEKMAKAPKMKKPTVGVKVTKEYLDKLCRGDIVSRSNHVCYYSRPHPVLFLSPVKTELLHQSPLVIMYHGILSEQQTDDLRKIARTKVKDEPVIDSSPFHAPVARLEDSASPLLSYLSRKVFIISGYKVDDSEPWKVINYGVGKMCPLHEDKPGKPKKVVGKYKKPPVKMGTFIVYLSNVTVGGAMMFPALRLTVFPEQGSALFWLNQLPSGQHDRAVVHTECASLRGHKWYAVKWPSEYMQKQCPIWKTEEGLVTEQTYFKVVEKHRNLWKKLSYKNQNLDINEMLKKPSFRGI